MKKVKALLSSRTVLMLLMFFTISVATPVATMAQKELNITMDQLNDKVGEASEGMAKMAKTIIGAVLFIALIGVIYMVASSHPKSKEAVIGWIVAVIIYIIAISLLG